MYASSCALTVAECIRTSKRCTFFTSLVFFAEAEEKGCIFFSLSVCFPWINTVEGNLPWNILLAQLKVTVMLRLNLSLVSVKSLYYAIMFRKQLIGKISTWAKTQPKAQSPFRKLNFGNIQNVRWSGYQSFLILSNFSGLFYSVPNILSRM